MEDGGTRPYMSVGFISCELINKFWVIAMDIRVVGRVSTLYLNHIPNDSALSKVV